MAAARERLRINASQREFDMQHKDHKIITIEKEKITVEEVLDRGALLARLNQDVELLQELIAFFLEDYHRLMHEIESAIAGQDAPGLRKAAHTLKGSLGNFGAQEAANLAYQLEMGGFRSDFSTVESAFAALAAELNRVDQALRLLTEELSS